MPNQPSRGRSTGPSGRCLGIHPRPRTGESLPSWLARLVEANGYEESPNVLRGLILGTYRAPDRIVDRLDHPTNPETYRRLAMLTCTTVSEIYALTAHSFAPVLAPPTRSIGTLALPGTGPLPLMPDYVRLLRPPSAAQWCPDCLGEAAHHRLLWTAVPVAACLAHARVLVAACTMCAADVPVRALITGQCPKCRADLAATPGAPLPEGDALPLSSQVLLQAWLSGIPTPGGNGGIDGTLPDTTSRALFRIIDGLRLAAQRLGARWPFPGADDSPGGQGAPRPTPGQALHLYATAFAPLSDWPRGWHRFLDTLARDEAGLPRQDGGTAPLGELYHTWIQREWRGPEFGWLQDEVDQYLVERHDQDFTFSQIAPGRALALAVKRAFLNAQEAISVLDMPTSLFERLLASGRLTRHESRNGRAGQPVRMLVRAEVLALRDEVARWIGRPDAVTLVGISAELFDDLVADGTIPVALPSADGEPEWRRFDSAVLIAWRDRIIADGAVLPLAPGPRPEEPTGRWLPAWHASKVVRPLGWTAAVLFAHVAEGTLRAFRSPGAPPTRLDALLFSRDELRAAVEAARAGLGWLSGTAATALLGCGTRQFADLVRAGTLTPVAVVAKTRYFTRASLDSYSAALATAAGIDVNAAAEILGIGSSTVQLWAAAGHLPTLPRPTNGHHKWRFDPATLIAWSAAHFTFAEVPALLGRDAVEVQSLIEQGRLVPVFGQRRGRRFARADVEELAGELASSPALPRHGQGREGTVTMSKFGSSARGLTAEEPMLALLDLLGHRWVLRILWELRAGPLGFGSLQDHCGGVSSYVLSERLTGLQGAHLVERDAAGGYMLAVGGQGLVRALLPLECWAEHQQGSDAPG